jgi:hypothetical protein
MALIFVGFSQKKHGFFPVPKCGKPRHILTKVGVSEAIIRCEFGLAEDLPSHGRRPRETWGGSIHGWFISWKIPI